jgi:hypothetical protein
MVHAFDRGEVNGVCRIIKVASVISAVKAELLDLFGDDRRDALVLSPVTA